MNKRRLGQTNLHVATLALGTAKFGWSNDDNTSLALLDIYREGGGNFIQSVGFCRSSITPQMSARRSEEMVGRWHQSRAIPRDSLVLAARLNLFRPAAGGRAFFINLIRESCEQSLRRLQTHYLDLLICEWHEHLAPVEDVIEAIDQLIAAGVVRHVVAEGFPPWRIMDSLHQSRQRHHCRFEALQSEYSLVTPAPFEADTLSLCGEHELGFIAQSPLAGGFLARRPVSIRELINGDQSRLSERFAHFQDNALLTALAKTADQHDASTAQTALAWVLRHPQVTAALVMPTSVRELQDWLQAAKIKLTDDENDSLACVTRQHNSRMEFKGA